ncbi:MAG: PDZ domain-containing protein [Candidatus Binatia bacterium]|nr:MAG: PDZ domain-containing protein [Candidatus Binatia bacterium]
MNAVVSLLERTVAASVALEVEVPESHPSAALLGTTRQGSGIIFDPLGLVLTANYVTLGARSIRVRSVDHQSWTGRALVQDFRRGFAVVAIQESGRFPALALRPVETIRVGDPVFLLSAVSQNGRRVHDGVVSAVEPFDAYWEYHVDRAVFTTAPNPGFGGGALIDCRGDVCGLVLLELAEIGRFTLAVPLNDLVERREELLRGQRSPEPPRGWLGLFCYSVGRHVVVGGVVPGSPAETGGLKSGDVVLMVDGQRITERGDLYNLIWQHKPGDRLEMNVYRDNAVVRLTVRLGDAEAFFA